MAANIIRPPIVGVPSFAFCPSKPKSLTVSPTFFLCKSSINLLPNTIVISNDVIIAAAATIIVAVVSEIVASAIRVRHPICGTRNGLQLRHNVGSLRLLRSGELVCLNLVAEVLNLTLLFTHFKLSELVVNDLSLLCNRLLQLASLVGESIVGSSETTLN